MKTITNIRREVATLANQINKKVKNLSSSFIRAWQIIKGKLLLSKVSGTSYGNRQMALNHLLRYNPNEISVELEREANNPHDTNAIKVNVSVNGSKSFHLGYVAKDIAELITSLLDKGISLIATFKGVTGGYKDKPNYGALIEITL